MKIILFDDHELFSEGLKEVLKKCYQSTDVSPQRTF